MQRSIKTCYKRFLGVMVLLVAALPMLLQAQGDPKIPGEVAEKLPDPSTSGALFDELAQLDNLVFTASFVTCDAKQINALMTDDIEFYHDLTGFSSGQQVRDNNVNLTKNCPGRRGISRRLVEGSLRVYPIHDYGAIQMGTHIFTEENASTITVAKFVHLWRKEREAKENDVANTVDGGKNRKLGKNKEQGENSEEGKTKNASWKISRVLSFDHINVESTAGISPQPVE